MLGISDFAQGCSKYSELKNFPWGLKETACSEKYIIQSRAHNSILPMSVDTLPLSRCNGICMQIADNSELYEMMVLGHVRYADRDTEIRLDENTKLPTLSRDIG